MRCKIKYLLIYTLFLVIFLSGCQNRIETQLNKLGYENTYDDFINSIKLSNFEAVKLFIELGIDINKTSENNKTPLYYASNTHSHEIVQLLIEKGANANSVDCPMEAACKRNNILIAKLLLANGAEIETDPRPLITAIESRSFTMTRFLLNNGANPNIESTPMAIELATKKSNIEIIKLLIERDVKLNGVANPLLEAIDNENNIIIELLLENGANPNVGDEKLPLQQALDKNNYEIFKLLLKYGAELNNIDNIGFYHKKAFQLGYILNEEGYINSLNDGNYDAVKLFLDEGFDPNLEINYDNFPLTIVTKNQRKDLISLLLDYGANINIHGFYLNTALYEAVASDNFEIIQYLIDKGAYPSDGIACAVSKNDIELATYFLDLGASPDAGYPRSAFIIASDYENYKMMELLISYGANINDKAEFNYGDYASALEIATYNNNLKLMKFLIMHGASYERCLTYATVGKAPEAFNYLINVGADPNSGGDLPLPVCIAASMGNITFLDLLIINGAEIDKYASDDYFKNTAISNAARNGNLETVKFLVEKGADIHRTDAANPLVSAAGSGKLEVVKYLLDLGVDKDIKDALGKTPLSTARSCKEEEVIKFLESYTK